MTNLTINSVCSKERIYPIVVNFQNGYPSENSKLDCALIQDEYGNKTIATEFNDLVYAGKEETEDLGQICILARNRITGKVRLIEAGHATLKPFNKQAIRQLKKGVIGLNKKNNVHREKKLKSCGGSHPSQQEPSYELVGTKNSQVPDPGELEPIGTNHSFPSLNKSNISEECMHLSSILDKEHNNESNLQTKMEELRKEKDFSAVKDMLVTALGLNRKIGEKRKKQNVTLDSENNNLRKQFSCIKHNRSEGKRTSSKSGNRKVDKGNVFEKCVADDAIPDAINDPGIDKVISHNRGNMQNSHDKMEVMNNFKNSNADCNTHLTEGSFVLIQSPSDTKRNLICDLCEKTFQDKGSLIFHFVAHNFINDNMIIDKESNIINTDNERKNGHKEIRIIKANYSKLESENEKKEINTSIDKIHKERYSNDNTIQKQGEVINRRKHLVAHRNDTISITESRMTTDNETSQEAKEMVTSQVNDLKVCENDEIEVKIRTDKTYEEKGSDNRSNIIENNSVMTRRMAAEIKNHENNTHNISNNNIPTVGNTFTCNDCGRQTKSKLSLITHIKRHSKKSTLKFLTLATKDGDNSTTNAKEHGITFKYPLIKTARRNLLNHNKAPESKYALCICSLCGYKTPYINRLTRHERAHTISFNCKYCNKVFHKSNDLKVHLRRHTGEKPFKCEFCGVAFAKRDTLSRHLKTHTGEKTYMCTFCTSKFKLLNGLKRHLKIHGEKSFKCTTCIFSSKDGSSLKRHMRCHSGEKPYTCNSCKYSTAYSHDLRRHAKTCKGT